MDLVAEGSSLANELMQKTAFAYGLVEPDVHIHYAPTGSGAGKAAIKADAAAFGGSDSLYKESDYASNPELQMYPSVAAGVVPIFNIAGFANDDILVLSRTTIVNIFLGTITHWNDTALQNDNPALASKLPPSPIMVIVRTKKSGTSEIFCTALSDFSPAFKSTVGITSTPNFPVDPWHFISTTGSSTVLAAYVALTPNSISFTVLNEAKALHLHIASFMNAGGVVVKADDNSLGYALLEKGGLLNHRMNAVLANAVNPAAWPIAGYTHFILRKGNHTKRSCAETVAVGKFLRWFYTSPTEAVIVSQTGLVPLPSVVSNLLLVHLIENLYCNDGTLAMSFDKHVAVHGAGLESLGNTLDLFGTAFKLTSPSHELVDIDFKPSKMSTETVGGLSRGVAEPAEYTVFATGAAADTPRPAQANKVQLPFAGVGVAPIYQCSTCTGVLILNKVALKGIFTGALKYWDDSVIAQINPGLNLPHNAIKVVIQSGRGASTATLAHSIFDAGTIAGASDATSWGVNPFLTQAGDIESQMAVVFHDFSIGYAAITKKPLSGVSVASVVPTISGVTHPPVPFTTAALQSCFNTPSGPAADATPETILDDLESGFIHSTNASCWPIRYLAEVEVAASYANSDCLSGKPTTEFVAWLYSETTYKSLFSTFKAPMPLAGRTAAVEVLKRIMCDGKSILPTLPPCALRDVAYRVHKCTDSLTRPVEYYFADTTVCDATSPYIPILVETQTVRCDMLPASSSAASGITMAAVITAIIALVAAVFMISIVIIVKQKIKNGLTQYVLRLITLLGAAVGAISVVFSIAEPTPLGCNLTPVLHMLAYVLCGSSLYPQAYRQGKVAREELLLTSDQKLFYRALTITGFIAVVFGVGIAMFPYEASDTSLAMGTPCGAGA